VGVIRDWEGQPLTAIPTDGWSRRHVALLQQALAISRIIDFG